MEPNDQKCSFCGSPEAKVGMLIAGDRNTICDRCVVAAIESIFRHATHGKRGGGGRRVQGASCSFCHRTREQTNLLVRGDEAVICDQCVGRILSAISQKVRQAGEPPVIPGAFHRGSLKPN